MASPKRIEYPQLPLPPFNLATFLDSAGVARRVSKYARGAVLFSQGDLATHVF